MKKYSKGTKFNDVLTKEVIGSWKSNIILDGATGCGKTYFVEHNLHDYCVWNNKNILFLCNRNALYEDLLLEKKKLGLNKMDIMLYQTLQNKLINHDNIKHYDYIVCDEFHYVLTDSLFNIYTDLTYDWLMEQTNSHKIFMSGTGGNIFYRLLNNNIVSTDNIYKIPYDYSYAKIKFYKKTTNVFDIIDDIIQCSEDEKVIYFANSLDRAKEVYKQFKKYSVFRCSKHIKDKETEKLNDINCIKTYNKDLITFNNRVLITTKALDNGITLKDRKIKYIISDIFDLDSAQQCLGRKRIIDKDDTCTFYIMNYGKKAIGNFKGGLHKKLNPIDLLVTNEEEFNKTYEGNRKFHSDYIYYKDGKRQYNKLAYWKMKNEDKQIRRYETNSFKKEFLLNLETYIEHCDLEYLEEYQMKDEFQLYLEEITGKKLFKEEQEELKAQFGKNGLKSRSLGINTLNGYLQDNNIPFKIQSKKSHGKRYWTIDNDIEW